MSIMDALARFSNEQALTATADSTDILDMGAGEDAWGTARVAPEIAEGRQLFLNVVVTTELDSAAEGASLTVSLQSCATEGGSYVAAFTTAAIAEAALVAGYRIASVALPFGMSRFMKLVYTVSGENFTSGAVSAWLGLEPFPVK